MKAKLFNEENLIREKMKKMSSSHDDKVADLNKKIRGLQSEIAKLRKDSKPVKGGRKVDNLFRDSKKKVSSRTASPAARSRSRSPLRKQSPAARRSQSKSPARSASASPARSARSSPSRSPSPPAKVPKLDSPAPVAEAEAEAEGTPRNSRSPSPAERAASKSPERQNSKSRSRSKSSSP